ncbi:hypothetical protein ABT224_40790 [Streptomyces sp. NPDC001584]
MTDTEKSKAHAARTKDKAGHAEEDCKDAFRHRPNTAYGRRTGWAPASSP